MPAFKFPRAPITRFVLPALAVAGISFAVLFATVISPRPPVPAQQLTLPAESPYAATISASGLIEANTRNIAVGSEVSGVVAEIPVKVGDKVLAGAALFRLDTRDAAAALSVAEAQWREARVMAADAADQRARADKQTAGVSISEDAQKRRRFAAEAAAARLQSAEAARQKAQTDLDLHTVTAPIEGRVLKINLAPGEYVAAGVARLAPVIMGNDTPLYVRAQIDETDLWRYSPGLAAHGALRGNRDVQFGLKYVRTEPYVQPKVSLTGDTAERVDTRVLEVIYEVTDPSAPVYIGQQVDVFIESKK